MDTLKYLCREGFGKRVILHTLYRGDYNRISRESGTCQTFPNTHGNVHGPPLHSDHRGNPTTVSSRHQPCRNPIMHGKHTIFPREAVPARKRRIHTSRHGKDASLPRKPISARKREKHGYRYIYIREHYSEQAPCTQRTHTSRESSTELQQLKMESSNMVALPCFNFNAEATPQMETSKKRPGADSIHNGKDIPVTSSRVTPVGPKDSIQLPVRTSTHTLMSVHSQDSYSSKTD